MIEYFLPIAIGITFLVFLSGEYWFYFTEAKRGFFEIGMGIFLYLLAFTIIGLHVVGYTLNMGVLNYENLLPFLPIDFL